MPRMLDVIVPSRQQHASRANFYPSGHPVPKRKPCRWLRRWWGQGMFPAVFDAILQERWLYPTGASTWQCIEFPLQMDCDVGKSSNVSWGIFSMVIFDEASAVLVSWESSSSIFSADVAVAWWRYDNIHHGHIPWKKLCLVMRKVTHHTKKQVSSR